MDSSEASESLFQEFWEWRLQNSPEFATICGIHDFDDCLESYASEAIEDRRNVCRKYLNEAFVILTDPTLSPELKENLDCFIALLNTYLKGSTAKGYVFPLNYLEGPHIEFPKLISTMKFNTIEDYHKLLSRFKELPVQISQMIEMMREGIRQNMTYHLLSVAQIPKQLEQLDQLHALQTNPQDCIFYKPFLSLPDSIPDDKKANLLLEAVELISHNVFPAFHMLKDFIITEYLQHTRNCLGICGLQDGIEYYQMCLNFYLSFYMTPSEIHSLGLNEVNRISAEIEQVIDALKLKMSIKEFSEKMRRDNNFYYDDADELLSAYESLISTIIQPELKKVIKKVPNSPLVIKQTPEAMPDMPTEWYSPGSSDGSRPGILFVNVKDLKAVPKYSMVATALREPGHHIQMSYLMESKNMPEFRKFTEDRKYSESPSRFPLHTAFIEGWSHYCEYLGNELNLYHDPHYRYGYLAKEMFRALRLVVDTGIHVYGWSLEKAVELMLEYTHFSRNFIESEVKRYITQPGQACIHKIGELKIKCMRTTAENILGPKFNLLEFHNVVLQSCGPLSLLEQKVMQYVKQKS